MTARPRVIYQLTLAATGRDSDSIHGLRATLKFAARRGLRAIGARQIQQRVTKLPAAVGASGRKQMKRARRSDMDMKQYAGSQYLKVKDVEDGPIRATIAAVEIGQYGRPDLTFEDGAKMSVNATNVRTLTRAFGGNSEDWIGRTVDLVLGEVEYQKEMQESVLVRPFVPVKKTTATTQPSSGGGGFNDDVPFGPSF